MARLAAIAVSLTALAACGGVPAVSSHEKGDYVVYEYSGSYRTEPVLLTKRVLSKTGNDKLEILVEWRSGEEARAWKEFVTDTPYNRANNVVDRLVSLEDGKGAELPNKDNLDLFRLYEGTYLIAQRSPRLVGEREENIAVGSGTYLCRVRTYKTKVLGARAEMTVADSGRFRWNDVSRRYVSRAGAVIYSMKVREYGNGK